MKAQLRQKRVQNFLFWICPVLLFLAAFVYLSPFLRYPAFNFIDDGASLRASHDLLSDVQHHTLSHWPSILIETQEGRMRPLYHLYYFLVYTLFGPNPLAFWVAQATMLGVSLAMMGTFIFLVTRSRALSLISLFLLFLVPTADNFYRFGTAEPKQMVMWLLFLLWCWWTQQTGWRVKTMLTGILVLWAGLLTKETSITFVPTFWFFWLWQVIFAQKRSREDILYGFTIGLLSSGYLFLLPTRTGYSSSFHFQPHNMWLRFLSTWGGVPIVYLLFLVSWCGVALRLLWDWRTHRLFHQKEYLWPCFFALQALLLLIVGILPWEWPLARYFLPLNIIGILAVALEIAEWWKRVSSIKRISFSAQLLLASFTVFLGLLIQYYFFNASAVLSTSTTALKLHLLVDRLEIAEVWLLLTAAMTLLVIRVCIQLQQRKSIRWQYYIWSAWLVFAVGSCLFFSSLIWKYRTPDAFLLIKILVVILAFRELRQWWFWLKTQKILYRFLVLIPLFICSVLYFTFFQRQGNISNFFRIPQMHWAFFEVTFIKAPLDTIELSYDTYQVSYGAVQYLLKEVPANTHIYLIEGEYEIIFEVGLYASHFRQQPIQLFTQNEGIVVGFQRDYPYFQYSADPVTDFVKDPNPKVLLTRQSFWQKISATPAVASISGQVRKLPPNSDFGTFPEEIFWQVVQSP